MLEHNQLRWTTILGNVHVEDQLVVARTVRTVDSIRGAEGHVPRSVRGGSRGGGGRGASGLRRDRIGDKSVGGLSAGARDTGIPLVDIVDALIGGGGRDVRLATADAFHEFERAVAKMRARVVRTLIEEDGLSLTEVALRLQISRQAVARLYRQAEEGDGQAADGT